MLPLDFCLGSDLLCKSRQKKNDGDSMKAKDHLDMADIHLAEMDLAYSPGHLQVRMLLYSLRDDPETLSWVTGVLESYDKYPPARKCEYHAQAHGNLFCRADIECSSCPLFPTSRWVCTSCSDKLNVTVGPAGYWSEGRCAICLHSSSFLRPSRR